MTGSLALRYVMKSTNEEADPSCANHFVLKADDRKGALIEDADISSKIWEWDNAEMRYLSRARGGGEFGTIRMRERDAVRVSG